MVNFAIHKTTFKHQNSEAEEETGFAEEHELAKRVANQMRQEKADEDKRPSQEDETQEEDGEERQSIEGTTKHISIEENETQEDKKLEEKGEQTRVESNEDLTLTLVLDKSASQDAQSFDNSKVDQSPPRDDVSINIAEKGISEEATIQVFKSDGQEPSHMIPYNGRHVKDPSNMVSYNGRDIKDEQIHEAKNKKNGRCRTTEHNSIELNETQEDANLAGKDEQTRVEPKENLTLTLVSDKSDKQDEQSFENRKVDQSPSRDDVSINIAEKDISEEATNEGFKSDGQEPSHMIPYNGRHVKDPSNMVSYNGRDIKKEQSHEAKKKKNRRYRTTKHISIEENETQEDKKLEEKDEQTRVEPKEDLMSTLVLDKADIQDEQSFENRKVDQSPPRDDVSINIAEKDISEEATNQGFKSDGQEPSHMIPYSGRHVKDPSNMVSYNGRDIKKEQSHEAKKKKNRRYRTTKHISIEENETQEDKKLAGKDKQTRVEPKEDLALTLVSEKSDSQDEQSFENSKVDQSPSRDDISINIAEKDISEEATNQGFKSDGQEPSHMIPYNGRHVKDPSNMVSYNGRDIKKEQSHEAKKKKNRRYRTTKHISIEESETQEDKKLEEKDEQRRVEPKEDLISTLVLDKADNQDEQSFDNSKVDQSPPREDVSVNMAEKDISEEATNQVFKSDGQEPSHMIPYNGRDVKDPSNMVSYNGRDIKDEQSHEAKKKKKRKKKKKKNERFRHLFKKKLFKNDHRQYDNERSIHSGVSIRSTLSSMSKKEAINKFLGIRPRKSGSRNGRREYDERSILSGCSVKSILSGVSIRSTLSNMSRKEAIDKFMGIRPKSASSEPIRNIFDQIREEPSQETYDATSSAKIIEEEFTSRNSSADGAISCLEKVNTTSSMRQARTLKQDPSSPVTPEAARRIPSRQHMSDDALMKKLKTHHKSGRHKTDVAAWVDERITKHIRGAILWWKDLANLTDALLSSCVDACDDSPLIEDYRDDNSFHMNDESSLPVPYVTTMNISGDDASAITEPRARKEHVVRQDDPHPYADSLRYLNHNSG